MGESERYIEYRHLGKNKPIGFGSENNAVMTLVILNIIFFLLPLSLKAIYSFYSSSHIDHTAESLEWFELSPNIRMLAQKPWTLISFMFSDTSTNFLGVLGNLLWLWFFGKTLQSFGENDKIIPIYLYGGIIGGLFFILFNTVFPSHETVFLLGAQCSTLALAMATCLNFSRHRVFTHMGNGISIWFLFCLYLGFDFLATAIAGNHLIVAHVGGLVAGILFILLLKKGYDMGRWMNLVYHKFNLLFHPSNKNKNDIKNKIFYKTDNRQPFNKIESLHEEKLNHILDKINQVGYDNLSEEEKAFLQRVSEKD